MLFAKTIPFADESASVHPKWPCCPPTQYFFAPAVLLKLKQKQVLYCERTGIFYFFWNIENKDHGHLSVINCKLATVILLPLCFKSGGCKITT